MDKTTLHSPPADAQAITDLYQRAAHELLLAYQRNKEATRHHANGAFRAALHHARLSCTHSSTAHECLAQALEKSGNMPLFEGAASRLGMSPSQRKDH